MKWLHNVPSTWIMIFLLKHNQVVFKPRPNQDVSVPKPRYDNVCSSVKVLICHMWTICHQALFWKPHWTLHTLCIIAKLLNSFKLKATKQAVVFYELGERTCCPKHSGGLDLLVHPPKYLVVSPLFNMGAVVKLIIIFSIICFLLWLDKKSALTTMIN